MHFRYLLSEEQDFVKRKRKRPAALGRTRCPYCNAVLHIEGMEDKNSNIKNTSASSEKTTPSSGNKSTVPKFLAFTRLDYIVLALTVIGMFWTMWSTGNDIFMIIVAVVGVTFVGARTIIRGQIYQNNTEQLDFFLREWIY